MSSILTVVLVIVSIIIVFVVIMQPSKDGGLGGLSNGGVTDSVFGAGRNEFLAKATWYLMAIFLISTLVLAKHETKLQKEREYEKSTKSQAEEIALEEAAPKSISSPQLEQKAEEISDKLNEAVKDATKAVEETKEAVQPIQLPVIPEAPKAPAVPAE
jgi:preprotein translocase subunit SecG